MKKSIGTPGHPVDHDIVLYCVKCNTKIKRGYYFQGQGPYGICCYKKMFGDMHRVRLTTGQRNWKAKLCQVGFVKDCKNCILLGNCEYSEAVDGGK